MRKRNIKALADILDGMQEIIFRTTWAEAQRLLIENPAFAKDKDLQSKHLFSQKVIYCNILQYS